MKRLGYISLVSALLLSASVFSGCVKKNSSDAPDTSSNAEKNTSDDENEDIYAGVADLSEGPLLTLSKTKASPGETAEVTVSVDAEDGSWSACGLHISFPEALECVKTGDNADSVKVTLGKECEDANAKIAAEWHGEMPNELAEAGKKLVYVSVVFIEDIGKSGDIAKLYFRIPDEAKPGEVYELEFYREKGDIFTNLNDDRDIEKYAFSHWSGGSITVE